MGGITDSVDTSVSKLREVVEDRALECFNDLLFLLAFLFSSTNHLSKVAVGIATSVLLLKEAWGRGIDTFFLP